MTIDRRHLIAGGGAAAAVALSPGVSASRTPQTEPRNFLRASGQRIVEADGTTARLQGVAFGNRVWNDERIPVLHHGPDDFKRLADMGMTLVRFYFSHITLEGPEASWQQGVYLDDGWEWIDRNIEWARAAGVRLSLNLHVPPGGFQSMGAGGALWDTPALQDRSVALWRAIAARYVDEPTIIGYDLINEPGVTRDTAQWQQLAQRIARAIREVDRNHLVIVERVNSVGGRWDNNAELNFVKIEDPNLVYTFHNYDPFEFTHQDASWVRERVGQYRTYPAPEKHWDKAGLREMMRPFVEWGRRNDVPLYLGEWGAIHHAFEHGRGGLIWAADMLDVVLEAGLPFTYHVWHESNFGLYRGDGPIDHRDCNQPLIDLFKQRLTRT